MIQKAQTRRGFTQENNNAVNQISRMTRQNNRHADVSLLSISSALKTQGRDPEQKLFRMTFVDNGYVGDPRLQPSGMTPLFYPPHPGFARPLPQGARVTARTPQGCCAGYNQALSDNAPASIGQVKPDINRQQAGKLSGSRLTYKCCLGFTLIELLVVVLIIGILAAVALPQYQKAVKKAQGAEALAALDVLDKAFTSYYLENGTYHGITPDTLHMEIPELHHFRYEVGSPAGYATGGSHFHRNHFTGPEDVFVELYSPKNTLTIGASWSNGRFQRIKCYVTSDGGKNTAIASCDEYFNCPANPRVQIMSAGSPTGNYTGGDCILK